MNKTKKVTEEKQPNKIIRRLIGVSSIALASLCLAFIFQDIYAFYAGLIVSGIMLIVYMTYG